MAFKYDATGIKMDNNFAAAPEGVYSLIITGASDMKEGVERLTKNGDPYVSVACEIDDAGDYLGNKVWNNIVFLPKEKKGAGMAVNFLKAISEPHEGSFEVNPENWVGKRFKAKLIVSKDQKGRPKNEIAYLVEEGTPSGDELPF